MNTEGPQLIINISTSSSEASEPWTALFRPEMFSHWTKRPLCTKGECHDQEIRQSDAQISLDRKELLDRVSSRAGMETRQ